MKTLVFTETGTAVLENEDGDALWASDEDADFAETNPNEFLDEEDAEVISSYLVEKGKLEDDEEIDIASEAVDDYAGSASRSTIDDDDSEDDDDD